MAVQMRCGQERFLQGWRLSSCVGEPPSCLHRFPLLPALLPPAPPLTRSASGQPRGPCGGLGPPQWMAGQGAGHSDFPVSLCSLPGLDPPSFLPLCLWSTGQAQALDAVVGDRPPNA